jgi:hypothetical protein
VHGACTQTSVSILYHPKRFHADGTCEVCRVRWCGTTDFVLSISSLVCSWYQGSFLGVKGPGRVVVYPLHLVPSFSMSRSIPLLPLCTSHRKLWGGLYLSQPNSLCIHHLCHHGHHLDCTIITILEGQCKTLFHCLMFEILESRWDNDSSGSE